MSDNTRSETTGLPVTRQMAQRTLILTEGIIAQESGQRLQRTLQERPSPAPALAVVDCHEQEWEVWETAVAAALTHISPPNLAAQLHRTGWQLAEPAEIVLILLADVSPGSGQRVSELLSQTSALVYTHLGLESVPMLIWLASDVDPQTLTDCLAQQLLLAYPALALSLRNESGLRLPAPENLAESGAELLWLLTTTPLRELGEWINGSQGEGYGNEMTFCTVGLHVWRWSSVAVQARFLHRWLTEVLAHWLARTPETATLTQVSSWLEASAISPAGFASHVLAPAEQRIPDFYAENWLMPFPWRIRQHLADMYLAEAADEEEVTKLQPLAQLRMAEPLEQAVRSLTTEAQALLDAFPIAGIAYVCDWLQQAAAICRQTCEQLLDQQEVQQGSDGFLANERGLLAAQLKEWLSGWPESGWRAWLRVAFRPWRWPFYLWRYWQLRQAGQQLSEILRRQAGRRRQETIQAAIRQALCETERLIWHKHNQVEEIGDLLSALARELSQEVSAAYLAEDAICATGLTSWLPTPWSLYERLAPDPAAEAISAAAACGGLGQQLNRLDERIGVTLTQFGAKRLTAVKRFTTVDILLAALSVKEPLLTIWQNGWEAASPLWRYDEARLNESARAWQRQRAFVCGGDAPSLADLLGDAAEAITWIDSADREQLFVLRARTGLTLSALTATWSDITSFKENV